MTFFQVVDDPYLFQTVIQFLRPNVLPNLRVLCQRTAHQSPITTKCFEECFLRLAKSKKDRKDQLARIGRANLYVVRKLHVNEPSELTNLDVLSNVTAIKIHENTDRLPRLKPNVCAVTEKVKSLQLKYEWIAMGYGKLLCYFPNIETLHLTTYGYFDLSTLWACPYIKDLTLNLTDQADKIDAIGKISHLMRLTIKGGSPQLDFIGKLQKLEYLRLSFTKHNVSLEALQGLTELKELYLNISSMYSTVDFRPLGALTTLRILRISTVVRDYSFLQSLTSLEKLDIIWMENILNFETNLARCPLQCLEIHGRWPVHHAVRLKDIAATLKDFRYHMDASSFSTEERNKFQIVDISPLLKDLPGLQVLHLNVNVLEGSVLPILDISVLKELPHLRELQLQRQLIEDLSPLQYCTELRTLNLSYTDVNDISCLKPLQNLRYLSISGTKVNNLDVIQDLKRLQILDACKMKSSIIIPESFKKKTNSILLCMDSEFCKLKKKT
jgi:Leucine-rich repeat (LRR) protein